MQKNASHFWVKLSFGLLTGVLLAACSSTRGEFHNTIEDYPQAQTAPTLKVPAGTPSLKSPQAFPIPRLSPAAPQGTPDLTPPGINDLGIKPPHHWYDF